MSTITTTLSVPAIHCDNCKRSIEGAVGALEGVAAAEVSVEERTVTVEFEEDRLDLTTIRTTIEDQGFDVEP